LKKANPDVIAAQAARSARFKEAMKVLG